MEPLLEHRLCVTDIVPHSEDSASLLHILVVFKRLRAKVKVITCEGKSLFKDLFKEKKC